jgi:predicted O-linked N-acetylglucosamine transferase (SPINDLY family)
MDYRVSDRFLEPPDGNKLAAKNEKACLMPDSWTCYEAPAGHPDVNGLPKKNNGFVTFGSFNNSCKINADVLTTWSHILRAVPNSRLMLLAKKGGHRRRMTDVIEALGVERERLLFSDYIPATDNLDQGRLLSRYHQIDIALDTFPYNGMTTTLDALWMGVPVISLVGNRNLSRAGLSILSNLGMNEFATVNTDAYVEMAVRTAKDPTSLARLRSELRGRMQASPLLDAKGFTRKLEAAFRGMWLEWCRRQGTSS